MKYLKMLGLAAVAAMALTAFLGASSASATVLCKTATNPCGSAWLKTGSLEGSLTTGSTSVLKSTGENPLVEDTCTASTVGGEIASQGSGVNVVGEISSLTFTSCSNPTSVLSQAGTLELNGTNVIGKGFEVTVNAGVSCVYSAGTGTPLGTFTGGNPAIIHINAVVSKKSGSFLCPSDSVWEGTYTITGAGTLHSEPS
jgi:hypothetical protein